MLLFLTCVILFLQILKIKLCHYYVPLAAVVSKVKSIAFIF